MATLSDKLIHVLEIAVVAGILGWILWEWFKRSDDRPRLVSKWIISAVIISITWYIAGSNYREGGGWGAAFIIAISCAICGIVLGITWGTNIGTFLARPLTSLFDDGGREIEPQPYYSIAEARRKRGKYREAAAEIRKQLAAFPGDLTGTIMLAEIEAEHFNDLAAAELTIERWIAQPELTPSNLAAALNRLADWHLRFGDDPDSARGALQRIIDTFPESEQAYVASQRIAHLATPKMLAEKHERPRIHLGQYEQRVGLVTEPLNIAPKSEEPGAAAAKLVHHLEEHPLDAEARENLALIYAEHYRRLDLARDQMEQLISQPNAPAKQIAHWLNVLADLHIKHADDVEGARATLHRITELFPKSAAAETARNRIAHLRLELRANKKSQVVKLGSYEQNIGLK
jgi:tetratricopeptide (TPR) repeat protein